MWDGSYGFAAGYCGGSDGECGDGNFGFDALCLPLVTCAFLHKSYGFCKKLL